jgi:8-oxo-dGTP diphosphatase
MTETPRHSVSVAGIVVNDEGKVLVIRRRDNGHWEPPGGVLETGETIEEGVRREVLEETGMSVKVELLTGIYKNMRRGIVALVYKCSPLGESDRASDEAVEIRWMTLSQVHEAMAPAYAIRVEDAFCGLPQTRAHDGINILP